MPVYMLNQSLIFPNPMLADEEGLLAVGGDLSVPRLELAYRNGIFPWFNEGEPILWWSPDPRFVLFPDDFKMRRSLRKIIRQDRYEIRWDTNFKDVIRSCSKKARPGQSGTWITRNMTNAYVKFHKAGFAHCVEAWREGKLVGGLYGVAMGPFFFGESMFYHEPDASKVALAALVERFQKARFIDCQVHTDFFESVGAVYIPRQNYLQALQKHVDEPNLWRETLDQYPPPSSPPQ